MSSPITMKTYGGLTEACLTCLAARNDEFSVDAYSKLNKLGISVGSHSINRVVEKSDIVDNLVREFLIGNPKAKIVNVGSGFCTRFYRVDNGHVDWTNVDFYDVGVLWDQVFDTTDRHRFVSKDVTKGLDIEYDLMIAEGVVYHIKEKEARNLLKGRVIFDVLWYTRTTPISSTQFWKFYPKNWEICIINKYIMSDNSLGYVLLDAEI